MKIEQNRDRIRLKYSHNYKTVVEPKVLIEMGFGMGITKSTNSFEFMTAEKEIQEVTLIPIRYVPHEIQNISLISADIAQKDINLKQSEVGTVRIEEIKITNKEAEIQYSIEGVVPYRADFNFLDGNGKKTELGDIYLNDRVDRQMGVYTRTYTFENATPEQVAQIAKIGLFTQEIELLRDEQITIQLQ